MTGPATRRESLRSQRRQTRPGRTGWERRTAGSRPGRAFPRGTVPPPALRPLRHTAPARRFPAFLRLIRPQLQPPAEPGWRRRQRCTSRNMSLRGHLGTQFAHQTIDATRRRWPTGEVLNVFRHPTYYGLEHCAALPAEVACSIAQGHRPAPAARNGPPGRSGGAAGRTRGRPPFAILGLRDQPGSVSNGPGAQGARTRSHLGVDHRSHRGRPRNSRLCRRSVSVNDRVETCLLAAIVTSPRCAGTWSRARNFYAR